LTALLNSPQNNRRAKLIVRSLAILSAAACIAPSSGLQAQSFSRKIDRNTFVRNIQFNFNIPSARAVGLGGAFVAIADDATAGMANPAGLTILTKPEISVHYKLNSFNHTENVGNKDNHDLRAEFHDNVGSQGYLSLVFPYGRYSFSLFRQELINFESSFEAPGFGSIFDTPNLDPAEFEPGSRTGSDIEVNNWGFAFAFRPVHNLSLGIANNVSTLEFRFFENLFQHIQKRNVRFFSVSSNSTDTRYGVNFGVKYEPTGFLSLGGVYRSGPRFRIVNSIEDVGDESTGQTNLSQADQTLVFKVPDVYSLGAALQVRNDMVLSMDVVRVEYSELLRGLDRNLKEDDVPVYSNEFPYVKYVDSDGIQDLELRNGTEIHLGLEYSLFLGDWQIPLRAGFYTDPAHVVYTTVDDVALKRLFPRGKTDYHGTFGFGTVLSNKIQLDMAVNLSRNVSEALLSAVFRF
jgi:long-chain fatty acid transport protein